MRLIKGNGSFGRRSSQEVEMMLSDDLVVSVYADAVPLLPNSVLHKPTPEEAARIRTTRSEKIHMELRGQVRQRLYTDALLNEMPILLLGGNSTAGGIAWLSVDKDCLLHYQVYVAGLDPRERHLLELLQVRPGKYIAPIQRVLKRFEGEQRILFSDEAHFWLNDYDNKQNCRIWSEANPRAYVETPLYPEKLTVWCALWAGGIIGPYFFKNDECHNVTVNGDRYRAMITNFFIPELNNHDVQELWFQQDGATCHTARATIDLLKDTFGDRLISRFGLVNWPPRPLDYFLWGYVKSLVYADKPQTLDHLEDNIRRVIADIRPQMLEKVIENWTSRLDYIRASRGSPMPEIIFKM
ncbi:hypothetical protein TNCV_789251 [Trichonephila clavipes]|nr:hypothetical protein TNCV_789251 [Trichonephila clavipes]